MEPRERKLIILYDQACQARVEGKLEQALMIEERIRKIKERG